MVTMGLTRDGGTFVEMRGDYPKQLTEPVLMLEAIKLFDPFQDA